MVAQGFPVDFPSLYYAHLFEMDVDVTVQGVQSACPSADDRRRPLYQVEQAHLPERVPHIVESNGFSLHALFLLPQIGLLFLLSLIIVLFGIGLGIVLQALVEAFIDEVYPPFW